MYSLLKRYRRKVVVRFPVFYDWWRYASNARRVLSARFSSTDPDARRIAQELTQQGIVIGASQMFLGEEGQLALRDAAREVLDRSRKQDVSNTITAGVSGGQKEYLINLVPANEEHHPDSPFVRLALDQKLLEIVSQYLGLWPRLHAINGWLNFPTQDDPARSQLWHRDGEDLKFLKVFIYLVDVDENLGPFSYIPRTHTYAHGGRKIPNQKDPNSITDQEMKAVFPAESWLTCTGPAFTMIIADTLGYHRGGRATGGNRILISLTYTSKRPFQARMLRIVGQPAWEQAAIQREAWR